MRHAVHSNSFPKYQVKLLPPVPCAPCSQCDLAPLTCCFRPCHVLGEMWCIPMKHSSHTGHPFRVCRSKTPVARFQDRLARISLFRCSCVRLPNHKHVDTTTKAFKLGSFFKKHDQERNNMKNTGPIPYVTNKASNKF